MAKIDDDFWRGENLIIHRSTADQLSREELYKLNQGKNRNRLIRLSEFYDFALLNDFQKAIDWHGIDDEFIWSTLERDTRNKYVSSKGRTEINPWMVLNKCLSMYGYI